MHEKWNNKKKTFQFECPKHLVACGKNSKPQRKSLIFLFFFLNTHKQSVWPNHKIFQRHDSEQCLVMFYRQNFSRLYTHWAYFSKYSDLALIYHHKQAEYSCDRFVIFPPSRFHTSSAAPIADSLWELETRFFFFFPPSLPLSGYESARLNGFSILPFRNGGWGWRERGAGGVFPAVPLMSEYSLSGAASALLAAIKQTVSPRTRGDYACVCVLFVRRRPAASGNSQPLPRCAPLRRQVLCDKYSQASFIKLCRVPLWFVLHFFSI